MIIMARLTVTNGVIRDDYVMSTGQMVREGVDCVPLPWTYPHTVRVVEPGRRTFLVDCTFTADADDADDRHELRFLTLDLPWHVVGPPLDGVYIVCLLLGFDADPRGAGPVNPRKFDAHGMSYLHHCLGSTWDKDLSFWNTTFRMRESRGAPGHIKRSMERLVRREWLPLRGVSVRVDP